MAYRITPTAAVKGLNVVSMSSFYFWQCLF